VTDLALCKVMGMSYQDIRALPREVYEVLIEDLNARSEKAELEVAD
jgi:hypothetical protein